ncbi:vomeronasal type-2 receptor 26-like [Mixophyes fleayi]|uniref:vomeronasal type-2 receptor 26-like n=1 Tax=Mixophyes fleayi TaxID=3061075 RepID=UPI003F4DE166
MPRNLAVVGKISPPLFAPLYDAGDEGPKNPAPQYYKNLLTFQFAIETFNNSLLLPNITLGYHVYDSCNHGNKAIKSVLQILSGPGRMVPNYSCTERGKVIGFIGDHHSVTTVPIAQLLGVYRYSQISYGATSSALDNRHFYPTFFQTLQNDRAMYSMLSKVLEYFGWTWIGILASYDDSGEAEAELLTNDLTKKGICVAFTIKISFDQYNNKGWINTRNVEIIRKSTAKVIVLCGTFSETFIKCLGENYDVLSDRTIVLNPNWASNKFIIDKFAKLFNCCLVLDNLPINLPDILIFFEKIKPENHPEDKLLEHIYILHYHCCLKINSACHYYGSLYRVRLHKCSGKELIIQIRNFYFNGHFPQVFLAVYVTAYALNIMRLLLYNEHQKMETDLYYFKQQLHRYLKNLTFSLQDGSSIGFNENGDFVSSYRILNWMMTGKFKVKTKHVGDLIPSATDDQQLLINESAIIWKNGANKNRCLVTSDVKMFHLPIPVMKCHLNSFADASFVVAAGPVFTETTCLSPSQIPDSRCSEMCLPGSRKVPRPGIHPCCYDCAPCSEGEISNTTDSENCIKCQDDEWPNEKRDLCIPKSEDFLSYTNDEISAVCIFVSVFFCFITQLILGIFISHRDTPIVKANNKNLSFLLLVSIMLSFLCVFLFLGRPVDITCMLRQISFGILFSIAVSSVLAKTIMVCIAFKATKPGSVWRKWMGVKLPNCVVFICSSVQVMICISWLSISPPFQELDTHSYQGQIIVQCNEGSVIGFYSVLGYMGVLAAVSFITAFIARTLPDSFNEAKYITFSMLVFCSVWIAMIPAYLSTKGKYMVAVEIFSILTSNAGLLGCIFFPKCYIILCRPERNTKLCLLENKKT